MPLISTAKTRLTRVASKGHPIQPTENLFQEVYCVGVSTGGHEQAKSI